MRLTLAIEGTVAWKLKEPLSVPVIVPIGMLPVAFKTVIIACGLVLVAFTVSVWVDLDQVALVTCSVSVGETVSVVLADTGPSGASGPW